MEGHTTPYYEIIGRRNWVSSNKDAQMSIIDKGEFSFSGTKAKTKQNPEDDGVYHSIDESKMIRSGSTTYIPEKNEANVFGENKNDDVNPGNEQNENMKGHTTPYCNIIGKSILVSPNKYAQTSVIDKGESGHSGTKGNIIRTRRTTYISEKNEANIFGENKNNDVNPGKVEDTGRGNEQNENREGHMTPYCEIIGRGNWVSSNKDSQTPVIDKGDSGHSATKEDRDKMFEYIKRKYMDPLNRITQTPVIDKRDYGNKWTKEDRDKMFEYIKRKYMDPLNRITQTPVIDKMDYGNKWTKGDEHADNIEGQTTPFCEFIGRSKWVSSSENALTPVTKKGEFVHSRTKAKQINEYEGKEEHVYETIYERCLNSLSEDTQTPAMDKMNYGNKWINGHDIKLEIVDILDNKKLTKLFFEESKTSPKVKMECLKICKYIKNKDSSHILHVEPTYTEKDQTTVVFLVFVKQKIRVEVNYKTEIRIINKYSEESRAVLYCEENSQLDEQVSRKIEGIIDKQSRKLMHEHKYLSYISASTVVSKKFGTEDHEILIRPCITLNVLVKGLIPLGEKPLPKELDDIPTDVREGGVQFCGNFADDIHENVRMGCKITPSSCPTTYGTLGGFVEHHVYGLCGITCAHVVFGEDLATLRKQGTIKIQDSPFHCDIYQPEYKDENRIGALVEVTFKEGGKESNDEPGIDVAIFKIDKRAPLNGTFPDCRQQIMSKTPAELSAGKSSTTLEQPSAEPPAQPSVQPRAQPSAKQYETGLVWGKTGIPTGKIEVQKFGVETGHTTGIIQFKTCAIRGYSFPEDKHLIGDKQYHIKSSTENSNFCELGDSGALVFMEDNSGAESELRCIGMVVALMHDKSCAITPIIPILDQLKVNHLKPFISNSITDQMNGRFDDVNTRFDAIETILKDIKKTVNAMINT